MLAMISFLLDGDLAVKIGFWFHEPDVRLRCRAFLLGKKPRRSTVSDSGCDTAPCGPADYASAIRQTNALDRVLARAAARAAAWRTAICAAYTARKASLLETAFGSISMYPQGSC